MWYLSSLLCCLISTTIFAWNLDVYDEDTQRYATNNDNYTIAHVSVFYVRAFLTLKYDGNDLDQPVTVIESTWPENLFSFQSRVFPNGLSHAKTPCDCNGILQACQTAVDRQNSFLWLIDNGSEYCSPKLIVYDLIDGNVQVHRYVFDDLHYNSLKSIQLITNSRKNSNNNTINRSDSVAQTSAIILLNDALHLLLYTINSSGPRKLTLIFPTKSTKSKKSITYNVLVPVEITLKTKNQLVITDQNNGLWLADLNEIDYTASHVFHQKIDLYVKIKYMGSLLGASTALTVTQKIDSDNSSKYLYYHLPRDGVILRWNLHHPLTAEAHEILYFTKSPIAQILFGAKGSVWIVYQHNNQIADHCMHILTPDQFNGRSLL